MVAAVGGIVIGVVVGRVGGRDPAPARRPTGRGRDLSRHPVCGVPSGRLLRPVGRACRRRRRSRHRPTAGDDPDAEQPDPLAEHLEDGRVHPQRLRVRPHRAAAAGDPGGARGRVRPAMSSVSLFSCRARSSRARFVWVFAASLSPGIAPTRSGEARPGARLAADVRRRLGRTPGRRLTRRGARPAGGRFRSGT